MERAAKLDFGEAEAVAEPVGGAGETLQFFPAIAFEEVELPGTLRQITERDAEEANHPAAVPVGFKEIAKDL